MSEFRAIPKWSRVHRKPPRGYKAVQAPWPHLDESVDLAAFDAWVSEVHDVTSALVDPRLHYGGWSGENAITGFVPQTPAERARSAAASRRAKEAAAKRRMEKEERERREYERLAKKFAP